MEEKKLIKCLEFSGHKQRIIQVIIFPQSLSSCNFSMAMGRRHYVTLQWPHGPLLKWASQKVPASLVPKYWRAFVLSFN